MEFIDILKNKFKNILDYKNKKFNIIVFIFIFVCVSITAILGLFKFNNLNNINNTLRIYDSYDMLKTGKMTSPWRDINIVTRLCFRNIFNIDAETGEIKPDLAKNYSISEDGLIYSIIFREDLTWSDGVPITIDDVIFSIQAAVLDEERTRIFPVAFDAIVGIEDFISGKYDNISGIFVNDNILTIGLYSPAVNFINVLSQFTILPKHILENENIATLAENDYWLDPVVSGMYKLGEYIPNKQITYVYNNYYKGDKPNITSLTIRDDYDINELDYHTTNDISEILDFRSEIQMQEINIDSIFYRYLVFNINKGGQIDDVIGDYRIRSAIAHAINIQELISNIYYNTVEKFEYGNVLINENFDMTTNNNNMSEKYHDYNPEKSKQLLEEANYDFSRPLILMYYYKDDTSAKFMASLAEDLHKVGFKTEIILSSNLYNSDPDTDVYDIALKGLSAFDIVEWYSEYDSSHDLFKYVFGGEPIFDDLIQELTATTSISKREDIFTKIQLLGVDALYKFPLFTMNYKAYINTNRLSIPDDIILGNPKYKYDNKFEEWIILD